MNDRRLIIIAGPSAVGKTTLLEQLQNEEHPLITTRLDTGPTSGWDFWNANQLKGVSNLTSYRAIVHYDFCDESEDERILLQILDDADDVAFLTLWDTPSLLLRRSNRRVRQLIPRLFKRGKFLQVLQRIRANEKKRTLYRHPAKLWKRYPDWLDFCDGYPARAHLVVRSSRPSAPVELADLHCPHLQRYGRWGRGSGDKVCCTY